MVLRLRAYAETGALADSHRVAAQTAAVPEGFRKVLVLRYDAHACVASMLPRKAQHACYDVLIYRLLPAWQRAMALPQKIGRPTRPLAASAMVARDNQDLGLMSAWVHSETNSELDVTMRACFRPFWKCGAHIESTLCQQGLLQLSTELSEGVRIAMPMQLHTMSRYLPAKPLTGCFCHSALEGNKEVSYSPGCSRHLTHIDILSFLHIRAKHASIAAWVFCAPLMLGQARCQVSV